VWQEARGKIECAWNRYKCEGGTRSSDGVSRACGGCCSDSGAHAQPLRLSPSSAMSKASQPELKKVPKFH
jgi:hypothetical protein